jgi:hypothetical protein
MISRGQLTARLAEVYGLHFSAPFSHRILFEPTGGDFGPETSSSALELSPWAQEVARLTGFKQWAFVMIAESAGLIGTSLNVSPVGGRPLFTYPEVKEAVRFTTEPAHAKMQTVSVGVVSGAPGAPETPDASETPDAPEAECRVFLRPMKDNAWHAHIHTAVFPYIPLKKAETGPEDTTAHLFENAGLTDILHLLPDDRPLTGLGESAFLQGVCWVVPVEKFVNH